MYFYYMIYLQEIRNLQSGFEAAQQDRRFKGNHLAVRRTRTEQVYLPVSRLDNPVIRFRFALRFLNIGLLNKGAILSCFCSIREHFYYLCRKQQDELC